MPIDEQGQQTKDFAKSSNPESWQDQPTATEAGGGGMGSAMEVFGGLQDHGSYFGNKYVSFRSNGTLRLGEAYGDDGANILTIIKRDTEGITGDGLAVVDLSTDTTSAMSFYMKGTGNSNKSAVNLDIDATNLNGGWRITQSGGTTNTLVYGEVTSDATASSNIFGGISNLTAGNIYYGEHSNDSATSPVYAGTHDGTGVVFYADKNNSGSAFEVDQDANDANDCVALTTNIANAGAGGEFLLSLNGSEYDSTAGGNTQTGRVKIKVNGNTKYMYFYDD